MIFIKNLDKFKKKSYLSPHFIFKIKRVSKFQEFLIQKSKKE